MCIVGNIARNIRCFTKHASGCRVTISFVSMLPKKILVLKVMIYHYSFFLRTVLAIAGEDFSIVASDTRLSEGYSIHSRDSPKCYKL